MKSNLKTSLLNLIFFLFISITAFGQTYVTISTSGTWTVPAGVTSITVRTWGGGGGGGGAASGSSAGAGGGGGGGGAYSIQTFTVSPSQTYNITIGNVGFIDHSVLRSLVTINFSNRINSIIVYFVIIV